MADIVASGREFSGKWQETTRQVQGDVKGEVLQPGRMQANLQAFGGGLQLAAATDGRRQSITLRSQGTDVQGADVTLPRR